LKFDAVMERVTQRERERLTSHGVWYDSNEETLVAQLDAHIRVLHGYDHALHLYVNKQEIFVINYIDFFIAKH